MKPVTLQQTRSETHSSVLRNTWPGCHAPETRVCSAPFPKSLRFSVLQFELFGVLFSISTAVCLGTEAAATTTALPHLLGPVSFYLSLSLNQGDEHTAPLTLQRSAGRALALLTFPPRSTKNLTPLQCPLCPLQNAPVCPHSSILRHVAEGRMAGGSLALLQAQEDSPL